VQAVADGDSAVGRKKLMGASMVVVEDKQQLSPVSVLDFHFDDDDGDEGSDAGTCCPPAFQFQRCTPPADLQSKLLLAIPAHPSIPNSIFFLIFIPDLFTINCMHTYQPALSV
jgi:hypothetical protein